MPRLILAIVIVFVVWVIWNQLKNIPPEKRRSALLNGGLWGLVTITVLLVITGRTSWIVAAIAATLPLVKGLFNLALRHSPLLMSWYKSRQQRSDAPAPNIRPEIDEAYKILGLTPDATREEIIQAHKKLMQKNHPDRGGNDYLAAKLNAAKDLLLQQKS